jgi:hypothetical protein
MKYSTQMLLTDFPVEILQTIVDYALHGRCPHSFSCYLCKHKYLAKLCIVLHKVKFFRPKLDTITKTQVLSDIVKKQKCDPNWLDMFITERSFEPNISLRGDARISSVLAYIKDLITNKEACASLIQLELHDYFLRTHTLDFLYAFTKIRMLTAESPVGNMPAKIINQLPNLTQLTVSQIEFDDNSYCFSSIRNLVLSRYSQISDVVFSKVFPNLEEFSLRLVYVRGTNTYTYIVEIGDFNFLKQLKFEDGYGTRIMEDAYPKIKLGTLNFLESLECIGVEILFDEKIYYPYFSVFKMEHKISDLTNLSAYSNLEVTCKLLDSNVPTISRLKTFDSIYNLELTFDNTYPINLDVIATLNVKKLILRRTGVMGSMCNITSLTSLSVCDCVNTEIYNQFIEYVEHFSLRSATFSCPWIAIPNIVEALAKVLRAEIFPPVPEGFWKRFSSKHQELMRDGKQACQTIKCHYLRIPSNFVAYAKEVGIKLN